MAETTNNYANMTDEEREDYNHVRTQVATLLAPIVFECIGTADQEATNQGITEPQDRFNLLVTTTTSTFNTPDTHARLINTYAGLRTEDQHLGGIMSAAMMLDQNASIIAEAPVIEAGWLSMSAFALLETLGREDQAPSVIPNSVGLLAFSRVFKGNNRKVQELLGVPIAPEFLTDTERDGALAITFSRRGALVVDTFRSRLGGCPFGALVDPQNPGTSPLVGYWDAITRYAFPESAPLQSRGA